VTAWPGVSGAIFDAAVRADPLYSIHLEMEDNLPLVQAHVIAEQVEQAILRVFPGSDVIIHQDPCSVYLARQGVFRLSVIVCKLDVKVGQIGIFV
jgi:ferrous-iron efflux pump FieF